jgi:phage gp36-like protein
MTIDDLQQVLAPDVLTGLTDDNGDGLPDAVVLDAALGAADREVRARLAGAVLVGDAVLPAALRDVALTLAVERLFERRHEALPGDWSARAVRARVLLDEMARGLRPVAGMPRPRTVATTRGADERATRKTVLEEF